MYQYSPIWLSVMTTPAGNYSASEHGLGPKVLGSNLNAKGRIYGLAGKFILLKDASTVPKLIREENLKYLRIGVGSELSCMMNPTVCWVCNKRTIWLYLAQTQGLRKANEALQLFNEHDDDSPMAYESWQDAYHPELGPELKRVAEEGARPQRIEALFRVTCHISGPTLSPPMLLIFIIQRM